MSTLNTHLLLSLLSLLARASGEGSTPACLDASLDRYEAVDDTTRLAVLDVADYPAINVPDTLTAGIPEGAAVRICAVATDGRLVVTVTRDVVREQRLRDDIRRLQDGAR